MSGAPKKRWGDRKDARWIRDMDSLHVILPHLMPHRTDAKVYVNMEFDVTETLHFIAKKNEGEEESLVVGKVHKARTEKNTGVVNIIITSVKDALSKPVRASYMLTEGRKIARIPKDAPVIR